MPDATPGAGFACPDLTVFCGLDALGREVTGQRLDPDRAVLVCRVIEPDAWCRRCGCERSGDTYYLFTAQGTMMQKCLEARGITAYPTSLVTDPLRVMAGSVGTAEAYALWYAAGKTPNSAAMTPPANLVEYGYSGVEQLTRAVDPIDAAYYAMSPAEQDEVQIAIDGKNGDLVQVSPIEQSCTGEVNATIFVDPDGDGNQHSEESVNVVAELIDGIPSAAAQAEIKQDAALQEAVTDWTNCMVGKGVGVSGAPAAAPQFAPEVDPATAKSELESEVAMATVGAECDAETQLNAAYQAAVKNWRISKIKDNAPAILEYFEIRAPFIAAAKQYLGVK